MAKLFRLSNYVVLIAVIALLLAALATFVFGGITTAVTIIEVFQHGEYNAEGVRALSIEFIEMIDLFLLGAILIITSIGLYQLFIDPNMDLPTWLVVVEPEQLKFNLLAVIVVMLAIFFLGEAARTASRSDGVLAFGLAVAAVTAAIALAVRIFYRVTSAEEKHIHEILQETAQSEQED